MKDLLLHIDSYPDATPPEAIDQAVRFAAAAGGALTALAVQVDLQAPSNYLASRLINLAGVCAEQEAKSLASCREAMRIVDEKLAHYQVRGGSVLTKTDLHMVGEHVALHARTRDLCLVPMMDRQDGQRSVAEAVVFGSGRPVLLFRPGVADLPSGGLGTIVVAWDGSRTAARALAAALPLLPKAKQVRVLTVVNEKAEARPGLGDEVIRHLEVHGVHAVADEVDAARRKVGQVFSDYVTEHHSDLLVMGAYGRSRVREFILGGATEYMLEDPRTAILLSH
ncbi:universal stress protein [Phenylobacterium sp.]|uniref:universal stress protein n=1 Tax=Phenylobacterium sp. TaxID=1871053 RepID=UPI002FE2E8DC